MKSKLNIKKLQKKFDKILENITAEEFNEIKDIYIKDEEDFATVIFQSNKAKEKLCQSVINERFPFYSDEHPIALYDNGICSFAIIPSETHKILCWAISHNLTIDSEVPIKIPEK